MPVVLISSDLIQKLVYKGFAWSVRYKACNFVGCVGFVGRVSCVSCLHETYGGIF